MDHTNPESVKKQMRLIMMVFVALLVGTVITVAVSYLDLSTPAAIAVALVVATAKSSLVACYFMHLLDERKLIYYVLLLTVFFFAVLLALPLFTAADDIHI